MDDILTRMLKADEALSLEPYLDTQGKLTIGYGRNLEDHGISEAEADLLLANDLARCYAEASHFPWYATLDDTRKIVILNMIFNLGLTRFNKFNNMVAALAMKDYPRAAQEMLDSVWAKQIGQRAVKLAAIMKTGVIQ